MEPLAVLTVDQAAKVLHVTPKTVRGLLAQGLIPGAMKVGGTWRISGGRFYQAIRDAEWPERESARGTSSGADRTAS